MKPTHRIDYGVTSMYIMDDTIHKADKIMQWNAQGISSMPDLLPPPQPYRRPGPWIEGDTIEEATNHCDGQRVLLDRYNMRTTLPSMAPGVTPNVQTRKTL